MSKESDMAHDVSITFKGSSDMEDAIGKVAFLADESKSQILRACVILALPILRSDPTLSYRVKFPVEKINKQ